MRPITRFLKEHTLTTVIVGCLLATFLTFAGAGFSYVVEHEIKIEHLEKTDKDMKQLTKEINNKLFAIQLDVQEIKTDLKYLVPKKI